MGVEKRQNIVTYCIDIIRTPLISSIGNMAEYLVFTHKYTDILIHTKRAITAVEYSMFFSNAFMVLFNINGKKKNIWDVRWLEKCLYC